MKGDEWDRETPASRARGTTAATSTAFLEGGRQATLDFGLRIDKVITNATGHREDQRPVPVRRRFHSDLKPANDTAKILVNAAGRNGQGGGRCGDGGTLPITGSSTALIAGLGALLLAAGAGGYVVARRRRTRFVA